MDRKQLITALIRHDDDMVLVQSRAGAVDWMAKAGELLLKAAEELQKNDADKAHLVS